MFEHLDTIPWSNVRMIMDQPATHVPHAIRKLISSDANQRREGYRKLDNYVVVQSDLFEAAWYVVPFLLEILATSLQLGRAEAYDLLYEIGNGGALSDQYVTLSNGRRLPLQNACRKAVLDGLPLYLEEIRTSTSIARTPALRLICSLEERYGEIISVLREVLANETEVGFRREVQTWLAEIGSLEQRA